MSNPFRRQQTTPTSTADSSSSLAASEASWPPIDTTNIRMDSYPDPNASKMLTMLQSLLPLSLRGSNVSKSNLLRSHPSHPSPTPSAVHDPQMSFPLPSALHNQGIRDPRLHPPQTKMTSQTRKPAERIPLSASKVRVVRMRRLHPVS